ncbi:MAG: amidohydrolase family protein, partial [Lachnospiraceae bacterium]|nr:amidohydrolase family protein [Candidatus Minthocola equi]
PALAPHAVYTCSESFLRQIAGIAQDTGIPMHIHLSETAKEVADCQNAHEGLTPIAYAERIGLLDGHSIVAHGVKATPEDIEILKNKDTYLVTNPMSNMKLGSGIAPIPDMLQAGVKVALGTDGAASNNTLNMFREMAAEAQIYKGIYEDSTIMPAQKVLKMATEDGAEALGMGDYIGKIKEGYKADLIVLNLRNPEFMPLNGVISSLVYSSYGSEVETVIIGGEVVMEDRRFVMIDEEQIYSEVTWRAQKLKECIQ